MQQTGCRATESDLHRLRHFGGADAMQGCFVQIDFESVLLLWVFNVPIDINDAGRLLEHLFYLASEFDLLPVVGTVNFSDQGLQNGWTGRYLRHLQPCAVTIADFDQSRANSFGNLVTLRA